MKNREDEEEMVDKPKKVNQINFRATDEKKAWIENEMEQSGKSKEQLMLEAIDLLMFHKTVIDNPGRGIEMDEFEANLNAIRRMFGASIDLCNNTEKRVREKFALQLESKDQIIAGYQSQIEALEDDNKALAEDVAKIKTIQKELDNAKERLTEKDRVIISLDGDLVKYKGKAEGYDELRAERDALEKQLRDANSSIKDLKKDCELEVERTKMAAVEVMREAVAHAQKEMQQQIDTLKETLDVTKEVAANAKAEANSLRGFRDANDELRITIGEQKARIAILEDQLEVMKLT